MLVEVAKMDEIALGGMKAFEARGKEIVLCNYEGKIYAISRRCGHTNAPMDMGTLECYILTCPMHHSQFDVKTDEVLSGPVLPDPGNEVLPEKSLKRLQHIGMLMSHIRTCDIRSYRVEIESIKVDVEEEDGSCI